MESKLIYISKHLLAGGMDNCGSLEISLRSRQSIEFAAKNRTVVVFEFNGFGFQLYDLYGFRLNFS